MLTLVHISRVPAKFKAPDGCSLPCWGTTTLNAEHDNQDTILLTTTDKVALQCRLLFLFPGDMPMISAIAAEYDC